MKVVLTQARLKKLLHYDPLTGMFTWRITHGRHDRWKAGARAGNLHKSDRRWLIRIEGIRYKAHRLAWLYMTGRWPRDQIDHKDTDSSNNVFTNLREATNAQNQQNRRRAMRT